MIRNIFYRLVKKILRKPIVKIGAYCVQFHEDIARESLPEFANKPINLVIELPRKIINPKRISIGDNVRLGPNCFISAKQKFQEIDAPKKEQRDRVQYYEPTISIGNRVRCNMELQIAAMDKVIIEDDVIIAANVFISDGSHGYRTAEEPYRYQLMDNVKPVTIKSGCWVGKNVVILPGVTIGENTIIGANSVVHNSIKAKCIVVGNPAKIIKEWNEDTKSWIKVDNNER